VGRTRLDEEILLFGSRLAEQLEPIAIGAELTRLSAADDDLQGLGQQPVGEMEGVPVERRAGADDVQPVRRARLLAARGGVVIDRLHDIDILDACRSSSLLERRI